MFHQTQTKRSILQMNLNILKQVRQEVYARFLPQSYVQEVVWVGIDVSGIARPRARTSADRSALYVHNLPECKKPITFGWQFSTALVLPPTPSSWTYVLDQQRVSSARTGRNGSQRTPRPIATQMAPGKVMMPRAVPSSSRGGSRCMSRMLVGWR